MNSRERRLAQQREYNRTKRSKSHQFYYGTEWKRLRAAYRAKHPICEMCGVAPSVIVDHIVEISDGGDKYDERNYQALCLACHNKKTAKERWERTVKNTDGDVLVLTEDVYRGYVESVKEFAGEEVVKNAKEGKFAES